MTDIERAYIAGFLDGDGSIILQIVRRKDYVLGFQIRASICFYQKATGLTVLEWIKQRLLHGYIRRRGEMADYTIVGLGRVQEVLNEIGPFAVLKAKHVELARLITEVTKIWRGYFRPPTATHVGTRAVRGMSWPNEYFIAA